MSRMQDLRRWFLALEKRERLMVGGGALLLGIVILYAVIVGPYLHSRAQLTAQVRARQQLLAWMQPAAARLRALGVMTPAALPGGSLQGAVSQTAASAGLSSALQQTQENADGSVRVQFSSVPFDGLLRWLDQLHRQYGITATDMSVQRGSGPGLVTANLSLQGPST